MNRDVLPRGEYWFSLLTANMPLRNGQCASVRVADGEIAGQLARLIAVVPDADNPYPRARQGEVGLLEGWILAQVIREVIIADQGLAEKRAIVAVIDVPSQAYGRREEAFGIHQALAGAVAAYADARLAGHPVIGLIVGKAMSGAFLAHGYQANRLIAFNDAGVTVHAMGKESAARITLRSVEALEALAATVPPMAYDIGHYSSLGLLEQLLTIGDPLHASSEEIAQVQDAVSQAIVKTRSEGVGLSQRLGASARHSSLLVRERMRAEW